MSSAIVIELCSENGTVFDKLTVLVNFLVQDVVVVTAADVEYKVNVPGKFASPVLPTKPITWLCLTRLPNGADLAKLDKCPYNVVILPPCCRMTALP